MPAQRYEEIALDLRRRIVDGEFPVGAALPSRRQLREQYDVGAAVLDKVMMLLRGEGLVETLIGVEVRVKRVPKAGSSPPWL